MVGGPLFVGVENDATVRLNKGPNRPLNSLNKRLRFLAELEIVDYVFPFDDIVEYGQSSEIYVDRFKKLSPGIIAISAWDPNRQIKEEEAKKAGIRFTIIEEVTNTSTTLIARLLELE